MVVTLTFNEQNVPEDGNVSVKFIQKFLKRLRYYHGKPFRYFLVGEYGERSWRPHYHCIFFGMQDRKAVEKAWSNDKGGSLGFIYLDRVHEKAVRYVAKYTIKKMTNPKDSRLNGRTPEFTRMSLRPGIGAGSAVHFAEELLTETGADIICRKGDVIDTFRMGGRTYPIGRYIRKNIRREYGFTEWEKTPPDTLRAMQQRERDKLNAEPITLRWAERRNSEAKARQFRGQYRRKSTI